MVSHTVARLEKAIFHRMAMAGIRADTLCDFVSGNSERAWKSLISEMQPEHIEFDDVLEYILLSNMLCIPI